MNASRLLTLTVGCTLLGGGSAALSQAPVAMNDGSTITGANEFIGDELVYPSGCPVVYETFNDTYPPNYGSGWTISDWPTIGCWGPAHKFVADNDYALCQILVSATHVTGVNQYRVRLHADDGGGSEPGTALGTWEFFNIPQNQAGPTPLLEADATGISLESGQSYWLSIIASGGGSNSWGVLRMSTQPGNERPSSTWKCDHWENRGTINSGAWRVTGNVGGGRFTIRLSGPCPGQKTLAWDGAGSGQMGIIVGNNQGNTTIPNGPCQGTQLGISGGLLLYNIIGTNGGTGQVSGTVGTQACGKFVQCINTGTCDTSNVAGPI